MRPNSPPGNKLAWLRPRGGAPSPASSVRTIRPAEEEAPWSRLLRASLSPGGFKEASQFASRQGERKPILLAELELFRGQPRVALALLSPPLPASAAARAWAHFLLDECAESVAAWRELSTEAADWLAAHLERPGTGEESGARLTALAGHAEPAIAAVAAHLLTEWHLARGEARRALSWARRAAWLMPRAPATRCLAARAAAALGDHVLAETLWRETLEQWPEDGEANEALGRLLMSRGRKDEARVCLERALAAFPARPDLCLLVGDLAAETERHEQALGHFEAAWRLDPRNVEALSRLAHHQWQLGNADEALGYFLELERRGPTAEEAEEVYEIIGYLLAESWLSDKQENARRCHAFFARAFRRFPANPFLRVYAARCLIAEERFTEARAMLLKILETQPQLPEALYEMGYLHLLEDRFDAALPFMRRAADLSSDLFYRQELAFLYADLRQWKKAETCFKRALASGAEDDELLMGLYAASYHQEKFAAAENLLRRVLLLAPDHVAARFYLGELLLLRGTPEDGRRMIEETMELWFRAKREKAETAPETAEDEAPDPEGLGSWLMGFACLLCGQETEAMRWLRHAASLDPELGDWSPVLADRVRTAMENLGAIPVKLRRLILERFEERS